MTREYMDEQYLKIMQNMNDEDREKVEKTALMQEIDTQDIAGGQATVYGQSIKFAPRELLDGKLTITMPEAWQEMSLELVKIKYPYETRPTIIMTDETTAINFTVNHLAQALKPEELPMFMNTMKNFTGKMTKAKFIDEGMIQGTEHGFAKSWFDFTVTGIDAEIYNLMFFLSFNQCALLVTFNCLQPDQERWQPIVFDMLKTLKVSNPNNTRQARRMVW